MYWQYWLELWHNVATEELRPLPPKKEFKPKFDLPILDNYEAHAPENFWESFPSNFVQPAASSIDHELLRLLALDAGFRDYVLLDKICADLKDGAVIGCKPEFRQPSSATNAPSSFQDGRQVTDALAAWIEKGFVFGPVDKHQVPLWAKLSGIMTRPKPNGSVRVIINLSAPKGSSVNDGIDNTEFPTSMDTLVKWLRALHKAGRRCKICKVDWSDAYKHIAVALLDTDLQWFEWLGKFFKELCLVFGAKSSAGIFDRVAKLVLLIVVHRSGMPKDMVIQFLDDCCGCAPENSLQLEFFDRTFFEVAEALGVRLAPRDDPEKSFAPCTSGTVLGVRYDTVTWTWALPEEKLIRLLHLLLQVMRSDHVEQGIILSVSGKIQNVKLLVPGGRFHVNHIIRAGGRSKDRNKIVDVPAALKRQLWYWFTMLQVCSGKASIPDPDERLPAWAHDVYTDSAGGSVRSHGLGAGAVTLGWWSMLPWSYVINSGQLAENGRRLDRTMSALELVGPLMALVGAHRLWRGGSVRFWVDNSGSVYIWRKGYSNSCPLCTTLVRAISVVAAGIGCRVDVVKITRCSIPLADMADALSKNALQRFWSAADRGGGFGLPLFPAPVSPVLLRWVADPKADEDLGDRLLQELQRQGADVLGCTSF